MTKGEIQVLQMARVLICEAAKIIDDSQSTQLIGHVSTLLNVGACISETLFDYEDQDD